MEWNRIGKSVVVIDLVIINLLSGIAMWKLFVVGGETKNQTVLPVTESQECGVSCQSEISRQIAELKPEAGLGVGGDTNDKVEITPVPTQKSEVKVGASPSVKKVRSVQYVTIPGNGAARSLSWVDLAGTDFYFDKADYSGLVEVYFEANVSLLNGNGKAYVRLLDATHGIGVDGGEIQTSSQTAGIVTSGRLNFWSGKNLIRVQAKSLTSDTSVYSYGRLKVITEN
jgi:hypothetical protein